ncbi:MAG: UDP-3-O-(3-hydroxymyristoyl)glucosamine N-acyltransferase [Burkholderiales bacterium]|nr:MAG: UDP-3-O-(3-hydroxymyristoyl)glucosamine N-acyltransferase [Burkholderiales bacterium]
MRRLEQGLTIGDVARLVAARLRRGDPRQPIHALASLAAAGAEDLSFLASARHAVQARVTQAAAVVVSPDLSHEVAPGSALLEVDDAHRAFAQVARHVAALLARPAVPGVHPSAVIGAGARLGRDVRIGPFTVIGEGAEIGDGAVLEAGVAVGAGSVVGAACRLHPRVTIEHDCVLGRDCTVFAGTVIGADGFGFASGPQGWEKIPQLGRVVIGDSVEIGANCAIDRGALEDTIIGDGCKLDNLIQVAHNVRLGEHTAIAGCVGIAGSAIVGRRCRIGGGAGILGHLEICDDVTISAMSLVTRSIREPGFYSGVFPLMDNSEWEKSAALLRQLPRWRERLRRLERTDRNEE